VVLWIGWYIYKQMVAGEVGAGILEMALYAVTLLLVTKAFQCSLL